METLKYLENSSMVKSFDVIDFRQWPTGKYLSLKIKFINNTILFVKEFQDEISRNYSYHWQDENEKMIIRWDNAPHYPEHTSFPRHKHLPDFLSESKEMRRLEAKK